MSPLPPSAVLVVDDDADHAWIARVVLSSIAPALHVEVACEVAAVPAALDGLPGGALVLMDRVIGGVETFDAIVALRRRRPDARVVMLSSMLTGVDRAYAIACGAYEAIEKPSSLDGWRAALGAIVAPERDAAPRTSRAA